MQQTICVSAKLLARVNPWLESSWPETRRYKTTVGREGWERALHSSGIPVLLLRTSVANYVGTMAAPQTDRQAESMNTEQRNV